MQQDPWIGGWFAPMIRADVGRVMPCHTKATVDAQRQEFENRLNTVKTELEDSPFLTIPCSIVQTLDVPISRGAFG